MSQERLRPKAPAMVTSAMWFAYLLLFAPLVTIVIFSFFVPVGDRYEIGLGLYRDLLANDQLGEALLRSCQIAVIVSVVSSIIGGLGALALERGRFPGRDLLALLTLVPLVLPELVLGLASLIWFTTLRLTLGMHSIILAHVTFTVSFVVVTVRARLRDVDASLAEAAADLGATPMQAFVSVTLPLALPAVMAGAMMSLALSFDDFLISFFTSGVGTDTLPMKLYSAIRFGLNRQMYALSSLLIFVTIGGLLAASFIRAMGGRQRHLS